jgi:hypothetical protein
VQDLLQYSPEHRMAPCGIEEDYFAGWEEEETTSHLATTVMTTQAMKAFPSRPSPRASSRRTSESTNVRHRSSGSLTKVERPKPENV